MIKKNSLVTATVLHEVLQERQNQDKKWGNQNHPFMIWLSILGEEVGEVNKHAQQAHFSEAYSYKSILNSDDYKKAELGEYRKELIQTAAVAVAMVESLDRNELKTT